MTRLQGSLSENGMVLLNRIERRQAVVAVIGLGYVGLPLAVAFAEAGFHVLGIDVDETRVQAINRGDSYIQDVSSVTLKQLTTDTPSLKRRPIPCGSPGVAPSSLGVGCLSATTNYDTLYDADVAIICVPTPLRKTKDPDMSYIISATNEIAQRLHQGMLIVLESTTYPGTTKELILSRLQRAKGQTFNVGTDFFLAFSPERIDPGRKDWTVCNTPKVIGGVTPHCLEVTQALYECVIEQVVPVSSSKVAEMVKLLENTFRAVNIALVNEVAIMCDRLGVDVWEVIEAAKTKPFGFMPFYPGPGLGGHCIPVDPQYLAWKLKTLNYNARFIQLAAEINFSMPQYVLDKIADALNEEGKSLKGSRVLILGVTYKADVSDLRESPALDLMHLLHAKGAKVAYHDPYVPQLEMEDLMTRVTLDRETLQRADCVVITTAHRSYDWEWVLENSQLVVDTRNATKDVRANLAWVVKL
jgi:UDP-N-acetyl-D-glucosamine dehydrogenase